MQQWVQGLLGQPDHDTNLVKEINDVQMGLEDFDCRIENALSELIHQGAKSTKERWWLATECSLWEEYIA